jgi:hypothetical protein
MSNQSLNLPNQRTAPSLRGDIDIFSWEGLDQSVQAILSLLDLTMIELNWIQLDSGASHPDKHSNPQIDRKVG